MPKLRKQTQISKETYNIVFERDKGCCVICGSAWGVECHHYIHRSCGGKGNERNLAMLCSVHHYAIHNCQSKSELNKMNYQIERALKYHYKDWKVEDCKLW